jgi:hypothetical protein
MLWLLLVAAALILSRTYVWSIILWFYGRAGQSEEWDMSESFIWAPAFPSDDGASSFSAAIGAAPGQVPSSCGVATSVPSAGAVPAAGMAALVSAG